jgi:hypothetical protein
MRVTPATIRRPQLGDAFRLQSVSGVGQIRRIA